MLEGDFLEEEIKEAVFELGRDKSSSPDGFPCLFLSFLGSSKEGDH